jgi:hypothetical protein
MRTLWPVTEPIQAEYESLRDPRLDALAELYEYWRNSVRTG